MEMTNTRIVPAPRDKVWDALNDPEVLKACIPGCESFEREGESAYKAVVAAKVGPVSARFTGRMELTDVVAPESYTMRFQGQGGAAGFANGEAKVLLEPAEGNTTSMRYTAKATVGGKLAQIGSRLVDGAAAKLADDFFTRFVERLTPAAAAVEPAVAGPSTATPEPPVPVPEQTPGATRWVRVLAIGAIIAILIWLYTKGGR